MISIVELVLLVGKARILLGQSVDVGIFLPFSKAFFLWYFLEENSSIFDF